MPRIRTLKPEALQHRKVGKLSDRAFRLWVACITQADDHGRLLFDADHFRLLAWGYHPKIRAADAFDALLEVVGTGLLCGYLVDNSSGAESVPTAYVEFPSWAEHQRVDHPRKSELPKPNPASIEAFREFARARERSRGFARLRGGSEGSEGRKDRSVAKPREGSDARSTRVPVRSSVERDPESVSGDGDPPGQLQAPVVSRNSRGPLAGTVAHVLASIRPVDTVPRGA